MMETSGQERKGQKLRALCQESKSKPEQKGPEVISAAHALKSFPGRFGWPGHASACTETGSSGICSL